MSRHRRSCGGSCRARLPPTPTTHPGTSTALSGWSKGRPRQADRLWARLAAHALPPSVEWRIVPLSDGPDIGRVGLATALRMCPCGCGSCQYQPSPAGSSASAGAAQHSASAQSRTKQTNEDRRGPMVPPRLGRELPPDGPPGASTPGGPSGSRPAPLSIEHGAREASSRPRVKARTPGRAGGCSRTRRPSPVSVPAAPWPGGRSPAATSPSRRLRHLAFARFSLAKSQLTSLSKNVCT